MTSADQPEQQPEQQPEEYDVPDARPEPADPLAELADTAVERTASPRHPTAMPPVAGAADPLVLQDGLTPTPVVPDPDPLDAEQHGKAGPGAHNAEAPSTGRGDVPTAGFGGQETRVDEAGDGPHAAGGA